MTADHENRCRIAAILACHNRKDTTLRCLASLRAATPPGVSLSVVLFDDASTDGTEVAVRAAYPDVTIVRGDGAQYWCGGMRVAMRIARQRPYDFLLWLNDDVELRPTFLSDLLADHKRATSQLGDVPHVIVGAVLDPTNDNVTYSGFHRTSAIHPAKFVKVRPNGGLQPCDTMNGNCVLLPGALVDQVGEIDPAYVQQIGDADYGYRCVEAGARLWVASQPVGTCRPNQRRLRWSNPELSFRERVAVLNTPHGLPLRPWLHFMWRFGGVPGVLLLFGGYAKWLAQSLSRP